MAQLKGAGTEDKRKVAVLAAFGLVALLLAIRTLFGGPDSPPVPVPAARTPELAAAPASPSSRRPPLNAPARPSTGSPTGVIDAALHPELMAGTENYLYHGSGRNIFSQASLAPPVNKIAIERPRGPIRPVLQQASVPTGPPPPPPIDLKFFGFVKRENGTRRAFLTHGDDVFVAAEGEVVSHRYKVLSIAPTTVQIEDLPYHNTQTLSLIPN